MQSDADTALEEAAVTVQAGLETAYGFGVDAFFPKEVVVGLKSKAMSEGAKELEGGFGLRGKGSWQRVGKLREVLGGLSICFSVKPPEELDDIATCITTSETSPEVFLKVDYESVGVIAPVEGARTDEAAGASAELRE